MRKLKRSEMQEHECIYCKYYERWYCKLEGCYIDYQETQGLAGPEKQEQLTTCDHCAKPSSSSCFK